MGDGCGSCSARARARCRGWWALGRWILLGRKAADSVWMTAALGVLLFPARDRWGAAAVLEKCLIFLFYCRPIVIVV